MLDSDAHWPLEVRNPQDKILSRRAKLPRAHRQSTAPIIAPYHLTRIIQSRAQKRKSSHISDASESPVLPSKIAKGEYETGRVVCEVCSEGISFRDEASGGFTLKHWDAHRLEWCAIYSIAHQQPLTHGIQLFSRAGPYRPCYLHAREYRGCTGASATSPSPRETH